MRRFIEMMWLVIAAFATVEMAVGFKEGGFKNQHFLIFAILTFAAVFMYFFRKRQRKQIESRKKNATDLENNAN